MYRYEVSTNIWELVNSDGPTLSHHACVVLDDRYLVLIGGWTGKQRTSDVYVYDTSGQSWMGVESHGFPMGAGLSSHTANILSNSEILVVGREGSLRTQRRSGNAFILSGSADRKQFTYRDHPMGVASRSGHTTTAFKSSLLTIGGRNDKLYDIHKIPTAATDHPVSNMSLTQLASALPIMNKLPCGRKNHSAVLIGDFVLVFGGETFNARSTGPVSEAYLVDCKSSFSWRSIGKLNIGRAGCICIASSDGVILHGGSGEGNKTCNTTYRLTLQQEETTNM